MKGVRALKLRGGDSMADMDLVPASSSAVLKESYVLAVTEKGISCF